MSCFYLRKYFDLIGCWWFDGRYYEAPLNPYTVFRISPSIINKKSCDTPKCNSLRPSPVIGGDWDDNLVPFEQDVVYRSFHSRFIKGAPWKQTDYFQFMLDWIDQHGSYKGLFTDDQLEARCSKLDELFDTIKNEGYSSQRELSAKDTKLLDYGSHLPPERKEITVNVTRDGDFLWSGGAHRLTIAKLLGIESIPVRIKMRHLRWQELRDEVYNGEREPDGTLQDHPDLQF